MFHWKTNILNCRKPNNYCGVNYCNVDQTGSAQTNVADQKSGSTPNQPLFQKCSIGLPNPSVDFPLKYLDHQHMSNPHYFVNLLSCVDIQ